jgi:hypothetical protein
MAEERVIKIVVDKKGADKNVNELNKDIQKTESSTKGLTNTLDKMSGGAVTAFKSLKSGLGGAVNGFKSLRVAIAATGIGLLITGIVAVKEAFTSSEEGQNKFAKILGVIGSITGNLSDVLSNLGMKIIEVFENPKQALSDFGTLIKDNIVTRFNGLLNLIPNLGKAISLLFEGKFSEAGKVATDSVGQIAFGVDSITDNLNEATKALNNFTNEVIEDAKIAGKIADQRAKADKLDRNLLVERAKANREIADLRFKAEQRDKFSAQERIKFLKEASDLEENITNKEINSAKLRLDAKVRENALANSTKADLDEEAQLRAKVIELETKRLNLSKLLESKIQSTNREAQAEAEAEKKRIEAKLEEEEKQRIAKAELEAKNEKERLEKIAAIQDEFKKKREDEEAETELQKLELAKQRRLEELENLKATEEQKADIIKFFDEKIKNEKLNIEQKKTDEEIKLNEQVQNAKKNLANQGLALIVELAGRGSKIGKGIAVAQTIRSGIEGVQNAYSTAQKSPITALFPAYPVIQAGLAGAFSALQVKKILSSSDVGGSAPSGGNQQPSAPSFNLVQGTGSNQIANTISQEQKPIEAFVVGSNVTNQQELDRQRVANSSIG